jgi:hypothetical protein
LKSVLESFIVILLVLAGIAGLSYNAFREDGFIEEALGNIWSLETQYPLIAVPTTIAAIVLFNMWRNDTVARNRKSKLPDILLYMLMACGAYFIAQYAMNGTI